MPDISVMIEIAELYDVSIPEIIGGERKSGDMNEGEKETVEVMATYATSEKETIIKGIRNESIIGIKSSDAAEYISLYCDSLVSVSVLIILLHSTGLLYKLKHRDSLVNLPTPLKYIITAVAAFAVAFILSLAIKLFLDNTKAEKF